VRSGLGEARFPFLAGVSETARRELSALAPRKVPGRAPLLRRGDPVEGAYFVVDGVLRVFYLTPEGREATLYRVEPGATCILALTAAFNRERYPAWVESGPRGATFVCVPEARFRRLLDSEPAFREFTFSVLSARIFELMITLEEKGSRSIEQRVARFLVERADAGSVVRATQAQIAADLGTAREVVFRALRGLAARGLVETGRTRVRVVDREGLLAVARSGGRVTAR
jgi:CRP/FNR family transcriptional regulator